jgi:hypothetical protein
LIAVFERFTQDARESVVSAQDHARRLKASRIETSHLLLALCAGASPTALTLQRNGVTVEAVEAALPAQTTPPETPTTEDDAAALKALGIDLEAIRRSLDAAFGPGALDRLATPQERSGRFRRLRRKRTSSGGHIPFSSGAKKALELALREAIRLDSGEIRGEHLGLGLLRADDPGVTAVLTALGVRRAVLRTDLESGLRRSA